MTRFTPSRIPTSDRRPLTGPLTAKHVHAVRSLGPVETPTTFVPFESEPALTPAGFVSRVREAVRARELAIANFRYVDDLARRTDATHLAVDASSDAVSTVARVAATAEATLIEADRALAALGCEDVHHAEELLARAAQIDGVPGPVAAPAGICGRGRGGRS